ncbi:methyl-accepting chemotaxis protein [Spirochaeta dissipatitropha]
MAKKKIQQYTDRLYRDFRVKVMVSVIGVVFVTLLVQNILLLYPPFAMLGLPNFFQVLLGGMLILVIIGIPTIAVLAWFITRKLGPLHRAVKKIDMGETPDEEEYFAARHSISRLWKNIYAANLVGFFLAWAAGVVLNISELLNVAGIIQLLFILSTAGLAALMQHSIITLIIAEPRAMLKIYAIDADKDVRGAKITMKSVLQTRIIALFLIMTMSFGFLQIFTIEHRFRSLVTRAATGEISLQQAEDSYYAQLSSFGGFDVPRNEFSLTDYAPHPQRFTLILIVYVIILMSIATGVHMLGSKSMLGQVLLIRKKLAELVQGDAELTRKIEIIEFDEVGDIVSSLNTFMDQISELLQTVMQASSQTAESSTKLQEVIFSTGSAAGRMVAAIEQVSSNADEQLKAVEETGNDIRGILGSLETIADQVNTQASFVEQTSSSVNEMAASIDSVTQAAEKTNKVSEELTKVAGQGSDAVKKAIEAIREIEGSSKQINDIVTVISKISAQTNMLAMNAAIEAAHAGDAGRGFAVVAEEVRNLAENSSRSAKGITSQIKGMLELIDNGVQLSENAGVSLDRISSDIQQTNQLVAEISLAMREQNAGTTEILQSISSLVESTQTISQVVHTQRERSEAMKQSVTELIEAFSQIQAATAQQAQDNTEIAGSVDNMQNVAKENEEIVARLKKVLERYSGQLN